jgi:hypothetical protein
MLPCSYCEANDLKDCRALDRSVKCNNCLELGRPDCDVHGLTRTLSASFRRQKEKLDKEEAEANAVILQAASKLARLRTQRLVLSERFHKAAAREERIIEDQEREEALATLAPQPADSSGAQEPSFDDWLAGVDPSLVFPVVGQGSSGGTPEVSRGS